MAKGSSCPRNVSTHRLISIFVSVSLVISFFLLKRKVCHIPYMYESEAVEFLATSRPMYTSQHVENYVSHYYDNLQVMHCIAFILTNIVVIFSLVDLTPKNKWKLPFQISAIITMIVNICIISYSAYTAFNRPCHQSKTGNYIMRREDGQTFNAYTEADYIMLIVTAINAFSAFIFICSTILLCTEVTNV